MALFKILRGSEQDFDTDLSKQSCKPPFNDGYCYFLTDSKLFYIDYATYNEDGSIKEKFRLPLNADNALNANNADTLDGKKALDFAPSGFGLGTSAKDISNTNLVDTLKLGKSGWYRGSKVGGAPTQNWCYFEVISDGPSFSVVHAYPYAGGIYSNLYETNNGVSGLVWDAWLSAGLIGTYTSLSQLGLTDEDMDPADLAGNLTKICNKVPRAFIFQPANSTNFSQSLRAKINEDIGLSLTTAVPRAWITRFGGDNLPGKIEVVIDSTNYPNIYTAQFDEYNNNVILRPFIITYNKNGFLARDGGTIKGNLTIEKESPLINFKDLDPDITDNTKLVQSSIGRIFESEHVFTIQNLNVDGNTNTRRQLSLQNSLAAADVKDALKLYDIVNGKNNGYNLYGEHNKPTAADVGAVNPNLLDNWYFVNPINSRPRYKVGDTVTGDNAIFDKWLCTNGILRDNGVEFKTSGSRYILTRLSNELRDILDGQDITISALFDDKLCVNSTKFTKGSSGSYNGVGYQHNSSGIAEIFESGHSGLLKAMKLELGSVQTLAHKDKNGKWVLNEIPNYAEQKMICSQYSDKTGALFVSSQHSNPNLLDNWYFADPVDQRAGYIAPTGTPWWTTSALSGNSGGTALGPRKITEKTSTYCKWIYNNTAYYCKPDAVVRGYIGSAYTIDRWFLPLHESVLYIEDSGIRLYDIARTSAQELFRQDLSEEYSNYIRGKVVTLSILMDNQLFKSAPITIPQLGTAVDTAEIDIGNNFLVDILGGATGKLCVRIIDTASTTERSTNIIQAIKLEIGRKQTLVRQDENGNWVLNDLPPNKEMELIKCFTSSARPGDSYTNQEIYHTGNTTADAIGAYSLDRRGAVIPNNADLNDYYTDCGNYYVANATNAATIKNAPITTAGFRLFVELGYGGSGHVLQFAHTSGSRVFRRERSGGSWTSWRMEYNTNYKPTVSELSFEVATDLHAITKSCIVLCSSNTANTPYTNPGGELTAYATGVCLVVVSTNYRALTYFCGDGTVYNQFYYNDTTGWRTWKKTLYSTGGTIDGNLTVNGTITGTTVKGAVWNDYAEYRESDITEPGRVICENGDDTLSLATERLQPGANVISDTFGFAIGETETAKTPIAVSGRVLVYPYEDRDTYKPGDAVCAAPSGTVSKMTREEIREYPERIIGTVSAIPNYETWGTGSVPVNGRIWIKVK